MGGARIFYANEVSVPMFVPRTQVQSDDLPITVRRDWDHLQSTPRGLLRNPLISCTAKALFGLIDSYGCGDNPAFPGIALLATHLGVSRSTVVRACRELEDAGYLTTVQGWRENGSQSSNTYWLHAVPAGGKRPPPGSEDTRSPTPEVASPVSPVTGGAPVTHDTPRNNPSSSEEEEELRNYSVEASASTKPRRKPSTSGINPVREDHADPRPGEDRLGAKRDAPGEDRPGPIRVAPPRPGRPERRPGGFRRVAGDDYGTAPVAGSGPAAAVADRPAPRRRTPARDVEHRPTSAAGLVERFQRGIRESNHAAGPQRDAGGAQLGGTFGIWLREGWTAETVSAMIDYFLANVRWSDVLIPPWKQFLARKEECFQVVNKAATRYTGYYVVPEEPA